MLMSQAEVSLIIVNLNGLEHLETLFGSIRELSFPQDSIEIIFVDNGSTDGSVDWVKKNRPRVRIIENEQNEGFASACNKGAKAATKDWLAFVNNDMRLDPEWLVRLFEAVEGSGKNTVCAGSRILSWEGTHIDFIGGVMAFYGHSFQKDFNEIAHNAQTNDPPKKTLFACGGAMLIQKEVYLSVGGFDDDYFAYFEDVDLGWRLWLLGYDVIFAPAAVAYHKRFSTARKYLGGKHLFLCERNALYTIYKNYSEENLQRVLPAALILLVHRALLHTDVFSLDFPVETAAKLKEAESPEIRHRESGPAKAIRMLRELGVKDTIKRARLSSAIKTMKKEGMYPVSEEGLSILSALPHFVSNLDNLNRKRNLVQANRKKSDSEIFSLFEEPFRPLPDNTDFERLIKTVSENFGIDTMFESQDLAKCQEIGG